MKVFSVARPAQAVERRADLAFQPVAGSCRALASPHEAYLFPSVSRLGDPVDANPGRDLGIVSARQQHAHGVARRPPSLSAVSPDPNGQPASGVAYGVAYGLRFAPIPAVLSVAVVRLGNTSVFQDRSFDRSGTSPGRWRMPSYRRPEGAEGITSSGRSGPRGPAIGAGRRRTRGRDPDQPGNTLRAPADAHQTGQRGVGPRRRVATRTQASRSVAGSTTRVPSGTNPTTTSRIPAGTPARSRIPPAAWVRSPGQVRSAAVGSAASAGGVDRVRARIRGEAPRDSPTILGPVQAGPGARPIATSPTASAGTIDTVAGVGAGGWGGFATGAVLAPGPAGRRRPGRHPPAQHRPRRDRRRAGPGPRAA